MRKHSEFRAVRLISGLGLLLASSATLAVDVHGRPMPGSPLVGTVDDSAKLQVVGKLRNDSGQWSYVTDGRISGWIRAGEPAANAAPTPAPAPASPAPAAPAATATLSTRPMPGSPAAGAIPPGTPVSIVTTQQNAHGEWAFVRSGAQNGWLPAAEARQLESAAPAPMVATAEPAAVVAAVPPPAPVRSGAGRPLFPEPDQGTTPIGRVSPDAQLELKDVRTDERGEWWQVVTGNRTGWLRIATTHAAATAPPSPAAAPKAVIAPAPAMAEPEPRAPVTPAPVVPEPAPTSPTTIPTAESIGLRARPLMTSSVVESVTADTALQVQHRVRNADGEWLFVAGQGVAGWLPAADAPPGLE